MTSVAFLPDGKKVASGSSDRAVWLWNVAKEAQCASSKVTPTRSPPSRSHPTTMPDGTVYETELTVVVSGVIDLGGRNPDGTHRVEIQAGVQLHSKQVPR